MINNKYILTAFIATVLLGAPWLINTYPQSTSFLNNIFSYVDNLANVFSNNAITVGQLHQKYDSVGSGNQKVKILVVAGHEPNYGGTEYKDLKERELNVELAKDLEGFLQNNSHYEVIEARNNNSWNPELQSYFNNHWNDIKIFFKTRKNEMSNLINTGTVTKIVNGPYHATANEDVALRLYGINKWVNDNKVDIAIHIHFNDYPRDDTSRSGKYSGLAIYVPEYQYSNSTTTSAIANSVYKRLSKYNATSNLPKEESGVVQEQDLIAIGSYNTLDAPSMLIEYGYIYEPQFADKTIRESIIKDLAFQTYLGIQDFFESNNNSSLVYDTLLLPHIWKGELNKEDILALQTALTLDGVYPAKGDTKNDCPRTGKFGPCTMESLNTFQKKYGITDENGKVGDKTKKLLNSKYSLEII